MDPCETHSTEINDYCCVIIFTVTMSFKWVHNFAFSELVWSVTTVFIILILLLNHTDMWFHFEEVKLFTCTSETNDAWELLMCSLAVHISSTISRITCDVLSDTLTSVIPTPSLSENEQHSTPGRIM